MAYVDLHLHLLPGVDDGPRTMATSLVHAAALAASGVHEATVTPHVGHPDFPVDVTEIAARTAALQAELDLAGIRLRLRPGGELHADAAHRLGRTELDLIAQGPRGARWVLLEAPFGGIDDHLLLAQRRLAALGYAAVVAHPERALGVLEDASRRRLDTLRTHGAVLQVNVDSLAGRHGVAAQRAAEALVREGEAGVLASDGHGGRRAHVLADGAERLRALGLAEKDVVRLTQTGPAALLRRGLVRPLRPREGRAGREARERRLEAVIAEARRR